MRFEICPADIIYTFGAYGMPTRFSHWSFGKAFHRMKTQYDYNLSRIYELVINSDPCYAFLLDGNSLIQNKLVVAHVFGHCDFFKNNLTFRNTSRQMMDSMTAAAGRIMEYEYIYGKGQVEIFLDAALALQEHVDPTGELGRPKEEKNLWEVKKASPYDDLWSLDEVAKIEEKSVKKYPPRPEKDMLKFFMEHARELEDWQRDILSVVRDEMLYFWPQIETKIMNEGWATYRKGAYINKKRITNVAGGSFQSLSILTTFDIILSNSTSSISPNFLLTNVLFKVNKRDVLATVDLGRPAPNKLSIEISTDKSVFLVEVSIMQINSSRC